MLCFRCGVCCRVHQPRLGLREAERLAMMLGLDWNVFIDRYADERWPGTQSFLLRQYDGSCVFLESSVDGRSARCRIHNFRPDDCHRWNPSLSKKECLKGLQECWGLKPDRNWRLRGPEEKLKEFEHFLMAIMGIEDSQHQSTRT